jgi:hypothetical protein
VTVPSCYNTHAGTTTDVSLKDPKCTPSGSTLQALPVWESGGNTWGKPARPMDRTRARKSLTICTTRVSGVRLDHHCLSQQGLVHVRCGFLEALSLRCNVGRGESLLRRDAAHCRPPGLCMRVVSGAGTMGNVLSGPPDGTSCVQQRVTWITSITPTCIASMVFCPLFCLW